MKLPTGVRVKSVELLRAGVNAQSGFENQTLHFIIPHVDDYEVAAITVA